VEEQSTNLSLDEALRLVDQLQQAVVSHEICGQATGVLVGIRGIDADSAWGLLQQASSRHNVKVIRIASALVALAGGAAEVADRDAAAVARHLLGAVPPISRAVEVGND